MNSVISYIIKDGQERLKGTESVGEIASRLDLQKNTINAPPINVGVNGIRVGFRMTESDSTNFGAVGLFDDNNKLIGCLAFRNCRGKNLNECWKLCDESHELVGYPGSPFENDTYFGELHALAVRYDTDHQLNPGIVVGFDQDQIEKYQGKGYGLLLVSLAIELSKKMGKRLAFINVHKRMQALIDKMTKAKDGDDNISAEIFMPYVGDVKVKYPKYFRERR